MIDKALRFVLDFVREHTGKSSCVRLCALACCAAGCTVALRHPEASATVATLIGGGTVALLTRSKQQPT